MRELLTDLERVAGDHLRTATVRDVLAYAVGPGATFFRRYVTDPNTTVEALLTEDQTFLRQLEKAPRATREGVHGVLSSWANRVAREGRGAFSPRVAKSAIARLIEQQRLEDRLQDPVDALYPLLEQKDVWTIQSIGPVRTVGDVLKAAPTLRALDAYFKYCIDRRSHVERRNSLWSAAAESPALQALSGRLKGALDELDISEPPIPARMEHVSIIVDSDTGELVLEDGSVHPARSVRISLIKASPLASSPIASSSIAPIASSPIASSRAPTMAWSGARGGGRRTVGETEKALMRVALERALDAVHDESNALHEPLKRVVETPRWERFLSALASALPEPELPEEQRERVAFRLGHGDDGGFTVETVLQSRRGRSWSKGRQIDLAEAVKVNAMPLDEHDERVLTAAFPSARDNPFERADRRGPMLIALAGHPRLFVGNQLGRVAVRTPEIVIEEADEHLTIALRIGRRIYAAAEVVEHLMGHRYFAFVDEARAEVDVTELDEPTLALIETAARFSTHVPIAAADALLAVLAKLPPAVGIELPPSIAGMKLEPDAVPVLRLEVLPGSVLRASILARPLGRGPSFPPATGPIHVVGAVDGRRAHTARDFDRERRAAEALVAAGLDRGVAEGRHRYRFEDVEDALALLDVLAEHPDLARVEWPEQESGFRVSAPGRFAVSLRRAEHWFEADAQLSIGEDKVSLARLMLAVREGRRYVEVGPRSFVRIADELREELAVLEPVVHLRGESARVAPSAAAHLEGLLGPDVLHGDAAWEALRGRLERSEKYEPEVPDALDAVLRDYQVAGVKWLLRTAAWAEGACLADEMGLGKTVQALALLAERASAGPSLVVCPTSLADNWKKECLRFAKRALRPVVYRGAGRRRALDTYGPGDLLIASYDVVARDREALSEIRFAVVVLDEAQAIKNPSAQRSRAAAELSADFRLALTGTPIENRLAEVFSLFSVLTPGLFGSWDQFRARFAVPIERHGDEAQLAQLRLLLRPFLLRRTKSMVARELPPRTEIVRPVDLSDDERALYEAERRDALASLKERNKTGDVRFAVLAALMRLRRLVCHPALVVEDTTVRSSKLDELFALLDDLRREDHRALVFSQFTSLLAYVRKALEDRGIRYLYLDGSTKAADRAGLVERWQGGDEPVFLVSLKAGGTGLNLTAADYVVHLDPWWNPAVEDQASDRAHRIGQTKPVTVVRLVAQGTIEERVLAMHADKRKLASGLLEGAETNATLDTDDLVALLESGPQPRRR